VEGASGGGGGVKKQSKCAAVLQWAQEGVATAADSVTAALMNEAGVIGTLEVMVQGCRGVYEGKQELGIQQLQVEATVTHRQGEYMGEASKAKDMHNMNVHITKAGGDKNEAEGVAQVKVVEGGEQRLVQAQQLEWMQQQSSSWNLLSTSIMSSSVLGSSGGSTPVRFSKFDIHDPRDELVLEVYPTVLAVEGKKDSGKGAKAASKRRAKPVAMLRMNMLHLQERVAEQLARRVMGTQAVQLFEQPDIGKLRESTQKGDGAGGGGGSSKPFAGAEWFCMEKPGKEGRAGLLLLSVRYVNVAHCCSMLLIVAFSTRYMHLSVNHLALPTVPHPPLFAALSPSTTPVSIHHARRLRRCLKKLHRVHPPHPAYAQPAEAPRKRLEALRYRQCGFKAGQVRAGNKAWEIRGRR
jgi:hypothetical protein